MAALKRARSELQEDLRIVNDKVETSGLEVGHLKRELQLAHEQNHASKLRIEKIEADLEEALITNPGTDLRRKSNGYASNTTPTMDSQRFVAPRLREI